MKGKKWIRQTGVCLLAAASFVFCYPVIFVVVGSFMDQWELRSHLAGVYGTGTDFASWNLLPMYPTLRHYVELLLDMPQFLATMWNSVKMTAGVLAGQLLVAVPAAWGFAKYRIPCRKLLWTMYIVLMLMPFQVKMLSDYLVLDRLHLLNTIWAIVVPGIFSTFPVFIMYHYFKGIPDELLQAARIDGAGDWRVFWSIAIPIGKNGIVAAMVLSFFEYWNLIEQPLVFLKDKSLWPLSLFLPNVTADNVGVALAASVLTLIPALLVFFLGEEALEEGVTAISKQ